MKVRIRNERFHVTVPCPLGLARFVIRCIPQRVFDQMVESSGDKIPEEDRAEAEKAMAAVPMDKGFILDILDTVGQVAREYKGLEIVRVESADGENVSITL